MVCANKNNTFRKGNIMSDISSIEVVADQVEDQGVTPSEEKGTNATNNESSQKTQRTGEERVDVKQDEKKVTKKLSPYLVLLRHIIDYA